MSIDPAGFETKKTPAYEKRDPLDLRCQHEDGVSCGILNGGPGDDRRVFLLVVTVRKEM